LNLTDIELSEGASEQARENRKDGLGPFWGIGMVTLAPFLVVNPEKGCLHTSYVLTLNAFAMYWFVLQCILRQGPMGERCQCDMLYDRPENG
jgi:hypothetical protein